MAKSEKVILDNFSYNYIREGLEVEIPEGQQMAVIGAIRVDGILTVDGEVICLTSLN